MKKKKERCPWPGDDPLMVSYHDNEWGMIRAGDRRHYEFLVLEAAQAGLSWRTVLHKREGYRKAFAGFDPVKVSKFGPKNADKLLRNPEIIRNRLKINAAIHNATLFLDVQKEFGSFDRYLWQFLDGRPIINRRQTLAEIPATTRESDSISRDLKKRGFKFVGSTVIYAHMQAVGMVNDHLVSCFRHKSAGRRSRK